MTTDVPTIAYEFNPLDGQSSYTSDASLLYPVASWDYLYDLGLNQQRYWEQYLAELHAAGASRDPEVQVLHFDP